MTKDENIHLGDLIKKMFGYWKIYVPIGILCLIGAIIFLIVTPKEYAVTSRIQLLGEKQGMLSEMKMLKSSGLGGLLGGTSSGINVEDEVMIMTSRNNLATVITENDLQIEVSTREKLRKKILNLHEIPFGINVTNQFLEDLPHPIEISMKVENGAVKKLTAESKSFKKITLKNQQFPFTLNTPDGNIMFTAVETLSDKKYKIELYPVQYAYETLIKEVRIEPSEKISDIVEINTNSSNIPGAFRLLNSIMERYNVYSKGVKIHDANLNAQFVRERLDTITFELAMLEHQIENYKQKNKMPDLEAYGAVTYMGNKETERLILETETRLRMIDYVINYMNKPENMYSAIPVIDGLGDKAILSYNQLALERQRLLQTSEPGNPALQLIEIQLREQRKMLLESIESIRNNVQISLDALITKDTKLSSQVDMLPTQEREFIEMKRQQRMKETMYLFLMQKLQEKELVNSPDEIAGRVVDKPYASYKHVFPKGTIILIIAFLLACMLSAIVIGIKMTFSNKKE